MIYSQIRNGIIENQIILEDPSLEPLFREGFDALIRTDNVTPTPSIGWSWDGEQFKEPELNEENAEV
jgi:hypothetical protein